jgi:hypothetical protein
MTILRLTPSLLLLCAIALSACAKSNRRGQPTVEAEPSPFAHLSPIEGLTTICAEGSSRDIPLDEITEAGFSAEDVLAYAEGEHRESIRWLMPEQLSVGPEAGEGEVTIAIERASERAKDFKPTTDVIGHGARCQPWITVDVVVTLQSEGGALNERFTATLFAVDPRAAYLRAATPDRELSGSLAVTHEASNTVASSFELKMTLSEHGATGSLYSSWSRQYMDVAWDNSYEIAHWGRAHCTDGSYAAPLDEPIELHSPEARASANDGVAWLNDFGPLTFEWADGGTTRATFSFEATGACVLPETLWPEPAQRLFVTGELELRTDDGQVDARWPGDLTVQAGDDGEVSDVWFSIDAAALPDGFTASTAELGFPLEARGGHEDLSVHCNLSLTSSGRSGTIELSAQDYAGNCEPIDQNCVSKSTFTPLVRGDVLPEP